jgi:hypothetical protein
MKTKGSFPVEAVGMLGVGIYCAANDALVTGILFALVAGRWIREWINA